MYFVTVTSVCQGNVFCHSNFCVRLICFITITSVCQVNCFVTVACVCQVNVF